MTTIWELAAVLALILFGGYACVLGNRLVDAVSRLADAAAELVEQERRTEAGA